MSEFKFEIEKVDEIPHRKYRKGSHYDAIITAFETGKHKMVKVMVPNKDPNYIRTHLKKRVTDLKLPYDVSVVNGECYLSKS